MSWWKRVLGGKLVPIGVLNLGGLCCVVTLWAVFGGGEGGLGPYFEAVGRAAISWKQLLLYVALISLYSAGVELLLRALQERLLRRAWPTPWLTRVMTLGVPALCYGLTHSIYHLPGVVYALCLGVLTAWAYARWRSMSWMAIWHVQWNLLAIGGAIGMALLFQGAPRDHMIATYKAEQIARGDLTYRAPFGWIDRHHYDIAMYEEVLEVMQRSPAGATHPLVLRSRLNTQWGTRHEIARHYIITSHTDEHTRRDVACAVMLDFQDFHEHEQATLGWWSGLALSAYQRDDMTAAWALCLDREAGVVESWTATPHPPAPSELVAMARETLTLEGVRDMALAGDARSRALWARVMAARPLWCVVP